MLIQCDIKNPPSQVGKSWEDCWSGPDVGLIASWLRGIEKGAHSPVLRERALRGELPPLAWKGGGEKPIKSKKRVGALQYLATWQGIRSDDLAIDTAVDVLKTCTKTLTVVTFTPNVAALAIAPTEDEE